MAQPTLTDQKRCTQCGECKNTNEFYKRASGLVVAACKACNRRSHKECRLRKNQQKQKATQICLELVAEKHPVVVTRTCRLCRQVKPQSEFEQRVVRTPWGMEGTRYTQTCLACIARGLKGKRRPKTEKQCIYCKQVKPASDFHSHNYTTRTGKNSRRLMSGCKECKGRYTRIWRAENKEHVQEVNRDWRTRNKLQVVERNKAYNEFHKERIQASQRKHHLHIEYGLTIAEYDAMVAQQAGKCLVCGVVPKPTKRSSKGLHVDHCHKSGKVRGLLCHQCNCAIGLLKEDTGRIRRLLEYIESYGEAHG